MNRSNFEHAGYALLMQAGFWLEWRWVALFHHFSVVSDI